MNREEYDRAQRWRATAETWFRKTSTYLAALMREEPNEDVRHGLGWEVGHLLGNVLWEAEQLAPHVPDDLIEDIERKAKALVSALRAQRLATKLEQTHGRTPEEAAAFQAKAAELRG